MSIAIVFGGGRAVFILIVSSTHQQFLFSLEKRKPRARHRKANTMYMCEVMLFYISRFCVVIFTACSIWFDIISLCSALRYVSSPCVCVCVSSSTTRIALPFLLIQVVADWCFIYVVHRNAFKVHTVYLVTFNTCMCGGAESHPLLFNATTSNHDDKNPKIILYSSTLYSIIYVIAATASNAITLPHYLHKNLRRAWISHHPTKLTAISQQFPFLRGGSMCVCVFFIWIVITCIKFTLDITRCWEMVLRK